MFIDDEDKMYNLQIITMHCRWNTAAATIKIVHMKTIIVEQNFSNGC